MNKKRRYILLGMNIFICISSIIIAILGVCLGAGDGQVGTNIKGIGYFKPFTIDSNVYMGLCSLVLSILLIKNIKREDYLVTKKTIVFYLTGVTSVFLTMLTVVVFLTPTISASKGFNSALSLYTQDMFFFHVLNPILSIVSFILLKSEKNIGKKENILSIVPMLIYSVVYTTNVVLGNWRDFYGFTFGGKNYLIPVVLPIMLLVTYSLGLLLLFLRKRINKQEDV